MGTRSVLLPERRIQYSRICTNNKRYTFIFGAFRLMRAFTVEKAINFGLEAIGRQTRGTNLL